MESKQIMNQFKENALYRIDESTRMIEKSIAEITERELWQKPNESLNSIGNLILHLCGNMTQYVISSLGNEPDTRNREEEFTAVGGYSKNELFQKLTATVHKVKNTIAAASMEELQKNRQVQGFTLSGVGIIIHVVEHYSYHTGQIAFWVKLMRNESLGFYDGFNLNMKNEA